MPPPPTSSTAGADMIVSVIRRLMAMAATSRRHSRSVGNTPHHLSSPFTVLEVGAGRNLQQSMFVASSCFTRDAPKSPTLRGRWLLSDVDIVSCRQAWQTLAGNGGTEKAEDGDGDEDLQSIMCGGPLQLDVSSSGEEWLNVCRVHGVSSVDVIFSSNTLHIIPWAVWSPDAPATTGGFRSVAAALFPFVQTDTPTATVGVLPLKALVLYGPMLDAANGLALTREQDLFQKSLWRTIGRDAGLRSVPDVVQAVERLTPLEHCLTQQCAYGRSLLVFVTKGCKEGLVRL